MNLSELRRQFSMAKTRNLYIKEWFVSKDEYNDLMEELKEFCMGATYIQDKPTEGMRILGVEIRVKE